MVAVSATSWNRTADPRPTLGSGTAVPDATVWLMLPGTGGGTEVGAWLVGAAAEDE
jgi:hypothetical protein